MTPLTMPLQYLPQDYREAKQDGIEMLWMYSTDKDIDISDLILMKTRLLPEHIQKKIWIEKHAVDQSLFKMKMNDWSYTMFIDLGQKRQAFFTSKGKVG